MPTRADQPGAQSSRGEPRERRINKVSEVVAREILERILADGMGPGDGLPPEWAMLEEYGVGRGSLREALRILETYGLIVIKSGPGGGPVVRAMGPRDFARLMTFYLNVSRVTFGEVESSLTVLEAALVEQAAKLRNPAQLKAIGLALEQADTSDRREFGKAMREFHRAIVDVPGASLLGMFAQALSESISLRLGNAISLDEASEMVSVHQEIATAISTGDGARAAALVTEHREHNLSTYKKAVKGFAQEPVSWV